MFAQCSLFGLVLPLSCEITQAQLPFLLVCVQSMLPAAVRGPGGLQDPLRLMREETWCFLLLRGEGSVQPRELGTAAKRQA
jgi:hypothetical protein